MSRFDPPVTVGDEEDLARFVFFQGHVRADFTIKSDAFIPHPYPDLSVHRHSGMDEPGLWTAGREVERQRKRQLVGRADLLAGEYRHHKLVVKADPLEGNPYHAIVVAWPADKPAQKLLAQQLAARARYRAVSPAA